ncbi:MAG: aspartate--tRNA ligase [Clostridia bacterium]|nr:aspartate--tRNA ligase [Clostridia bacterium]
MYEDREKYLGEFNSSDIGKKTAVYGWVAKQRDLGNLVFVDLRDRSGVLQLSFGDNTPREVFEIALKLRQEFVIYATGTIRERSSKNPNIPTGDIELDVETIKILNKSDVPPFEITDDTKASENTRLKYRYLDLRRPSLKQNLIKRHKIAKITRDYFDKNGFIEIETPMMIKSTPEGARDFVVPSRLHKGSFYALPQSPQLYKQLSMVAGFDRYMQIARCFRDEDLRADRQPEFTQIDVEMSFVKEQDIMSLIEGFIQTLYREILNKEIKLPLKRLTYDECISKYGTDKPDLRYDLEIINLTDISKNCGFGVFENTVDTGLVGAIKVPNGYDALSRKEISKIETELKGIGAKGLAFIRIDENGEVSSPFAKFLTEGKLEEFISKTEASKSDVILIVSDMSKSLALSILGYLRTLIAKKMNLYKDEVQALWVTEFPFFELNDDGEYEAAHHPFTCPKLLPDENLLECDKGTLKARAYDLVIDGVEIASGSIRITDPELQNKIFTLLGMSEEEYTEKFGFLLEAFRYGAPPHGGIGLGLDRLVMQMLNLDSLREVIAYPKLQNATEAMTDCPSQISEEQLEELGIKISEKK